MISYIDGVFRLTAGDSSYWFRVTPFGHLEQLHFGRALKNEQSPDSLAFKHTIQTGSTIAYDQSDPSYSLDTLPLEWSGCGCGDYRFLPAELKMPDGGFSHDFTYVSHEIRESETAPSTLPAAYGAAGELEVLLEDKPSGARLSLIYDVFDCGIITRRAVLHGAPNGEISIRRIMSYCLDLPDKGWELTTLDGGWIKETHRHTRALQYGAYVNSSETGASSNRHNPGFMLSSRGACETTGEVYGFNLVYSGNHYSAVELSAGGLVRVAGGINPHCFEWTLKPNEEFETPQAVLCHSDSGFGGMSEKMHRFVSGHIVRGEWRDKQRPVLLNDWEACFFKFTGAKLTRLARHAKRLGIEMFVLDDGWFGARNSDTAGLGDYNVNRKKLPCGLDGLARRINRSGMKFGLWFEPESVNPDSDLYRAHPEYAVAVPARKSCLGRNQLLLDLCNPAVRDYIVDSVGAVLDSANIEYVKWDMNRHITDAFSPALENQGEFYHRYITGLYDVLHRIFAPRQNILLESCSSGGNRFDLGMLCYSPQIWASDDTDPAERLKIQGGLSLLYPQSCFGAHVSMAPHQQTLRDTPLSTRFNVAAFGCLGYELDLKALSHAEKKEIKRQVALYKKYRSVFQYGRLIRHDMHKGNKVCWQVLGDGVSAEGFFQTLSNAAEGNDVLPVSGLDPNTLYSFDTAPQSVYIRRFGGLLKHLLPFELRPDGAIFSTINRLFALNDGRQSHTQYGDALMSGVRLEQQFVGTGYSDRLRIAGDFGSTLYIIEKQS